MCFPGASTGDKFSLAPSQECMNYLGYARCILDTASISMLGDVTVDLCLQKVHAAASGG